MACPGSSGNALFKDFWSSLWLGLLGVIFYKVDVPIGKTNMRISEWRVTWMMVTIKLALSWNLIEIEVYQNNNF